MRHFVASSVFLFFFFLHLCFSSPFNSYSGSGEQGGVVGHGYNVHAIVVDRVGKSLTAELHQIQETSVYGADIPTLNLLASFETNNRLRVRITDSDNQRWEIPDHIIPRDSREADASARATLELRRSDQLLQVTRSRAHVFSISNSDLTLTLRDTCPFTFTICRRSTGGLLFNTLPMLVFKDRYLEISSFLPKNKASIYGLGDHTKKSIRLIPNKTLTMWNSDTPTAFPDLNLYGSHPFYMDVRSSSPNATFPPGITHGVLLLNSNGMDVVYGGSYIPSLLRLQLLQG